MDSILPWLRWMKKYGVLAQLLPKDPLDEKEYFHRIYFAKKKRKEALKAQKREEKRKK